MHKKIGRQKKNKESFHEEEAQGTQTEVLEQSAPVPEAPKHEPRRPVEKKEPTYADHIAESRKALDQPLAPGQQFFESPDGEIIIGEADKTHIWSRRMNNGRGGFVNPRR